MANQKKSPSKEFIAFFNKMTKGPTNIDTRASKRRMEYYTNKVEAESYINRASLALEFTI